MTCTSCLEQLASQFDHKFQCGQHWLRESDDTWRAKDEFLSKYPFAEKPASVAARLRQPDQVRDFLHWIEVRFRPHGGINLGNDRAVREAAENLQTFRGAVNVALDCSRSLADRIDDDVWALLPGFGRDKYRADRQIARKIVATYFPTEVMPIFSTDHLEHFVDWLGFDRSELAEATWRKQYSSLSGGEKWQLLSKMLIESKAHHQTLADRDNVYFMYCLYCGPARPPTMSPNPCSQHLQVTVASADCAADGHEPRPPSTVGAEPSEGRSIDDVYELETGIKKGQLYHNSKAARKAIELRAMELAVKHYEAEGWSVHDVSKNHSYDLSCTRGDEELRIEVKGTTADGSKVILTRSEVANAREFPRVALFIVRDIKVSESGGRPVAAGGQHREWNHWDVDAGVLEPYQYEYTPPR